MGILSKKKIFVFTILFFFFSISTAHGATLNKLSRAFNNTGLVGYWTLDGADLNWGTGTVRDSSTGIFSGLLEGLSTTTSPVKGKIGQALRFKNDGTFNYVDTFDFAEPDMTQPFTLSAWIYPMGWGQNNTGFILRNGNYNLDVSLSGNKIIYVVGDNSTEASSIDNTISLNTWQHVAVVYDGTGTATIYINGVNQTFDNTITEFDAGGWVSISDFTANNNFDGLIDEVRTYNRALSAKEVKQLYNAGQGRLNSSTASKNLLSSGLVGYWTFDGMDTNWATGLTQDKTSNANNGILNNMSTTTSPVFGRIGQGLDFTTAEWVYVGNPSVFSNLNNLSISVWIKPRSFSGGADKIVSKTGGVNPGWVLSIEDQSNVEFQVNYNTTDLFVVFNSSNAFSNTKWTNVILTWDGTSQASGAKLYADGVEITNRLTNQNGSASRSDDANTPIVIGARSDTGGPRFSGQIDDVRIYNRVLSATEAGQITNAGKAKINKSNINFLTSGLVGYWTFDGPDINWSTGKALDKSGQGNDGNIANMSTTTSPKIGKTGQGFSFDGVNDRVTFSALNIGTVYTTSFWIQYNDTGDAVVIGNLDVIDGTTGYAPYIDGTTIYARTSVLADGFVSASHGGFTPGVWYYIAVVRNGTRIDFYKNGVSLGGGNLSGNNSTVIRSIGSYGDGSFPLLGYLDDVRLYNRALSTTEIMQIYNSGK